MVYYQAYHSFIYIYKYLLITHNMPGTVLGTDQ